MRLLSAHITNYRSIEDSDLVDVDPDVTCLVGKNEAGKTALLQALYRLNPVEQVAPFDEDLDFPAKRSKNRREYKGANLIPVVKAKFELTADEAVRVTDELGQGALTSRQFSLTKGYRNPTGGDWGFEIDEAAIVQYFVGQLDPTTKEGVGTPVTIAALLGELNEQDEMPTAATELRDWLASRGGEGWRLVLSIVEPMLPRFVYFENYDLMPGKVAVPDLAARASAGNLNRGEVALVNLLAMAGTDLEDFTETNNHERLIRRIENAGTAISEEVFEYWTQNTSLSVKLEVLAPEDGAVAPLDKGPILQVRVNNSRHAASVPFDERSRGFVWFFSFLAYFDELEQSDDDRDLVLLLDEPGLSLHGQAQADLLRLVEDRLAPKHQVIYTTHSPFLVSSDHLGRVRTVIDHEPGGTQVSAEIFKADDATAAPLLAAMGIEMSQTLFVGPHVLLLEGPSDLIFLDVLSAALGAAQRPSLDPRWVKVPVGGAGKLSTFVTLLGANKLDVAVLIDSSAKDQGALKRLQENDQLRPGGLLKIGEITGQSEADIEDLFDEDFYLSLVNAAFAIELGTTITSSDLNANIPRIVKRVEDYFKANGISGGHFDHYRPAAVLLRPGVVAVTPSENTLSNAEALFTKINALLTT